MALRSALSKIPTLGLRSPPMGTLMGPVRALSPAAGSRLLSSHGASEGKIITQEELARGWAEINRMEANIAKRFERMEERRRQFFEGQSVGKADIEEDISDKILKMTSMAADAVIILGVPAALYMVHYS